MNTFLKYLSGTTAGWLCIFVAVLNRIINVLFVSYAGRDKMFMVLQSKSLLSGHGLSIPQYYTTNIDTPFYDLTPFWPPGYPVLLAPFLKLFDFNIYWATTTLDIIACIGLIFITRKICVQLEIPRAGVNIMTLIAGCFEYTFINESLPTDTITLVLFLFGLSFLIKVVTEKIFAIKHILLASIFLFVPCLFRYNYPAISLGLIVLLSIISFIKKDEVLKRKSSVIFFLTAGLTVGFFITMKILTGHFSYATPTQRGFFPENIIHWFPVAPSSFINLAFFTSQGIRLTGITFEKQMLWLEVLNVLSILLISFFLVKTFFRKGWLKSLSPVNLFLLLGFTSCIILFGVIGYVSLTYEIQKGFLKNWNYVYEPRYFAFANIFLQILFIVWVFVHRRINSLLLKSTAFIIGLLLFTEVSHNIYFNSKVAFNFGQYKSAVYREQDYSYFFTLIKSLETKYPGHEIAVASPGDNFFYYTANYLGHKGIADARNLLTHIPSAKQKTILVLVLYDNEIATYAGLISKSDATLQGKAAITNFFIAELNH